MTTQNLKKKKNNNLKDQKRTKPSQASPIPIRLSSKQGVKRAVEELRESEKKYKELADFLPEMVYEADKNGEIVFANRCAFELFGYAQEDFDKGVSLFEMVIPEDREKVIENLRRLLKGEKVTDNQYTALRKDGNTFPIIATAKLIIRENKSVGVRGVLVDITERKLAEETLRTSEEEAKQLAKENAAMAEIGRILSSTLNIDEVYERFAEEVKKLIPFDRIVISTINIEKAAAKNVYMAGKGIGDRKVGETYPLEGSGNAEIARTKSTLLVQTQDFNEFKDRFPMLLSTFQAGFRSIMDVPLFLKGQIIGGLLLRSLKPYAYTDRDAALAEKIGNQIAGAIVNAQFFAQHEQAEETLRSERDKFRGMLLAIHDGVDIVNNDYIIEFQNKILRELFGEKIGEKCYAAYMGLEEPCHFCSIQEAIKTGNAIRVELVGKNGRNYELNSSPFTDVDGNVKVIELVRDITERKRAEEALRQSEEKYRTILENIADGYYEVDLAGNLTFFNDSVIQLLGYSKEELIGKNNREYMNQENAEKLYQAFNKVYRTGEPTKVFGWEIIRKDGTKRFVEASVSLVKNPLGQPTGFRGIVRDITERKRAEDSLQESKERYRTILENIEDGYYEVDLPGNFTFFNDSLCRMLGYSRKEMLGMGNQQYTDEENRKKLFQAFNEVYGAGKPIKGFGWEVFRKDGAKLFGEVSVSLIKDSTGRPIGFRGIARDITERKRAEEEIKQTLSLLNATLESTADGILVVDREGKIESFNQKFVQMWRIPESIIMSHDDDQALGFVLDQLKDPEGFLAKVKELYNQPGAESFDLLEFKDGRCFERYSLPQWIGEQSVGRVWSFRDVTERQKAEDSLRTEKQRLQSLSENAPFGMVMIDQDGTFRYINPKFRELFGYDLTDVPDGKSWFRKAYPDPIYRHQVISDWKKDLESSKPGEKRSRIYTVHCKDGTEKTIHFIPVQMAMGENLMACEDITDRKRAEEALVESEERFRAMTATAADAITVMDNQGCITYWNPAAERMFGYTPEEAIGKELHLFLAPERYYGAYKRGFETFMNTGQGPAINNTLEFIALRKDGTEFPMEVSTSAFKLKGQWHAVGIIRDITERKWVEDALQKSEMRFQELFNDAPVGYFEYNVEGRLTNVNRTELEMLGYKIEEMIGQPVWKFVVEREVVRQQILGKLAGALPPARGLERTYQRKDGTILPVLIEDRILCDSKGKIIGIRSTIHDITDRKRAEQEMNTLAEQLRQSQKMEAIGRLAGGIAHDFNNLLTIIKGYSQLSLLDLKESDTLWGNIQEIQKATQRATDLTRQLLAFSRRQILDLKVLNLNTLLRDLDKMLRRIIGEDIELFTLLAEDLGRVRIDPGQFEQMILNLAVNSRDAMLSGGKLTIETANVELDEDYTHAHIGVTPGRYVRLSFSDTGAGMLPEVREKVFEPFFTTKEKGKGTGLGLSMVYGIVKQSGGNIWVYSESGQGTTFKIYLPIVEQDLDALEKKEETEAFPRGSETVLLVEDEPLVRDLALRLLSQQGYTILEAANGEEALRVVKEQGGKTIQLLLTDVVMPQMGGKELADKLKSLRPDIKVLYTSGYTDNAIVHHGVLEAGTHFLQKPFSPKSLFSKVREVLDR